MVFEPPVGVKQCLMQTLNSVPSRLNDAIPVELGRLIFMLAWLHSIITERSRYTPIGWTKNYDFNYSDFDMGLVLLVSWVEEYNPTRWLVICKRSILKYSVSEVNCTLYNRSSAAAPIVLSQKNLL